MKKKDFISGKPFLSDNSKVMKYKDSKLVDLEGNYICDVKDVGYVNVVCSIPVIGYEKQTATFFISLPLCKLI